MKGGGGRAWNPTRQFNQWGGGGLYVARFNQLSGGGGGGGGRVLPTGYRLNQWNQQWRRNGSKGEGLKFIIHK